MELGAATVCVTAVCFNFLVAYSSPPLTLSILSSSICLDDFLGEGVPSVGLFFMEVKNLAKVACLGFLPAEEGNEDDINNGNLDFKGRADERRQPVSNLRM
ncbi:hypothetical protein WN66_00874 [Saccharomyces cerevisiae]|nr:hypothetical protein WN66_00874 [Saccharomyces cerevisiae]